MSRDTYRFGLLSVVFGGFVSLNGPQFYGASTLVSVFGLLVMTLGAFVGLLGLAGEE